MARPQATAFDAPQETAVAPGPRPGRLASTRSMTRRFSICARSAPAASRAQCSHGTGWSRVSASATAPTRSSRSSVRITSPDSHRAAPALAHGTQPVGYISYDVWRGGTGQCPPGRAGARDAIGWRPAAGPRGPPGRGRRRDRHGPPRPWATRAARARTPGDTRWPGARRWPSPPITSPTGPAPGTRRPRDPAVPAHALRPGSPGPDPSTGLPRRPGRHPPVARAPAHALPRRIGGGERHRHVQPAADLCPLGALGVRSAVAHERLVDAGDGLEKRPSGPDGSARGGAAPHPAPAPRGRRACRRRRAGRGPLDRVAESFFTRPVRFSPAIRP